MITKYHIFENNNVKKLFYHATKFEFLPNILEHGLTPNNKSNWSIMTEWSRGKVFITDNFFRAIHYGTYINRLDYPNYFPILRIWIDPKTLIKDKYDDFYSTEPVKGFFELTKFTNNYTDKWESLQNFVEKIKK